MRYLKCNIARAQKAGMCLVGRLMCEDGQQVFLNESGVMDCQNLEGTLEERAEWLEGTLLTDREAEEYVAEQGLGVADAIMG